MTKYDFAEKPINGEQLREELTGFPVVNVLVHPGEGVVRIVTVSELTASEQRQVGEIVARHVPDSQYEERKRKVRAVALVDGGGSLELLIRTALSLLWEHQRRDRDYLLWQEGLVSRPAWIDDPELNQPLPDFAAVLERLKAALQPK